MKILGKVSCSITLTCTPLPAVVCRKTSFHCDSESTSSYSLKKNSVISSYTILIPGKTFKEIFCRITSMIQSNIIEHRLRIISKRAVDKVLR